MAYHMAVIGRLHEWPLFIIALQTLFISYTISMFIVFIQTIILMGGILKELKRIGKLLIIIII